MAARRIVFQPVAHQTVQTVKSLSHVGRAGSDINARRRSKSEHRLTPCPIPTAAAPMFPHRIHDPLRSGARFVTQLPERHHHRHDLLVPECAKTLPREAWDRRPIAVQDARVAGIYPMSLTTNLVADRTHPASTRWLQTQQPASAPRPDSAAFAPLPLRS